jgi:transposase
MLNSDSLQHSWDDLWNTGQRDLGWLVNFAFTLQNQLRQQLETAAQNSSNSSRPPSTDPNKPRPKSLRARSARKTGGQPGHPGKTLQPSEHPDHIVPLPLDRCPCGADLSEVPAKRIERRQVFDLPPLRLVCTENQAQVKDCPCCHRTVTAAFPPGVNAPVQYGKAVRALTAYLYDAQAGASRRVSQIFADLFGYRLSEATSQSARQDLSQELQPFEDRLSEVLPTSRGFFTRMKPRFQSTRSSIGCTSYARLC